MSFERALRVAKWWGWLPAFRAAAEFESIQKAGLVLEVSPSAVSRAVRQLEFALGEPLFERRSSGVSLTPRGERLLRATRDAMRSVDDSLSPPLEVTRVGIVGPFLTSVVADALRGHTGPIRLETVSEGDVVAALCRGDVDLVVGHREHHQETIQVEALGGLSMAIASVNEKAPVELVGWPGELDAGVSLQHTVGDLAGILALAQNLNLGAVIPVDCVSAPFRISRRSGVLRVFLTTRRAQPTSPPAPLWVSRLRALVSSAETVSTVRPQ